MPASRIQTPAQLPGATEFSADRELLSPLWLVRTLKQTAWLYRELEDATKLDKNWGRRKEPGSWALAYLAFVVSDSADIEPWWAKGGDELWRECGFQGRPPYPTVYERFIELESVSAEFTKVAAKLIQHCRKHQPLIGAHVHVDGTEAETHAALVHDCKPGEGCKWHNAKPKRTASRPKRVSTEFVRAERQKAAEAAPSPPDTPELGEADEVKVTADGRMRIRVGEHWFRTLDATAGVRAYTGPRGARKFWHGFYNQKAIDHYTGAPVAVGVYSASTQEYYSYPDLLQRACTALGDQPEVVVADKGFSVESVFAHNTNLGIASVIPWRKRKGHERRHDFDTHDRHGIPRCKHCGAPTRFVRFRSTDKQGKGPRLWFKCELGATPACEREQSISCSADWRLLIPLWRTDAIYHELEQTHGSYERVHRHWRERYLVGGDNLANRPKRRGRAWQELRAQGALLAEWLTIAFREGWLGSARRNRKGPKTGKIGERHAEALRRFRAKIGLRKPYGTQADALGIGQVLPPSRRGKSPPGPAPPDAVPF